MNKTSPGKLIREFSKTFYSNKLLTTELELEPKPEPPTCRAGAGSGSKWNGSTTLSGLGVRLLASARPNPCGEWDPGATGEPAQVPAVQAHPPSAPGLPRIRI